MEPEAIKAFRKARGQSQSAFGADLDVDRKTVQRWEHGETRPPGILLDLACETLERQSYLEELHQKLANLPQTA